MYRLYILISLFILGTVNTFGSVEDIYSQEEETLNTAIDGNWQKVREQQSRNDNVRDKITKLENTFKNTDQSSVKINALEEILDEWRFYVKRTLKFFPSISSLSHIQEINIPKKLINDLPSAERDEWNNKFQELNDKRSKALFALEESVKSDLNSHYKIFLEISKVRSYFYEELMDADDISLYSFDYQFVEDLKNELLIVPHRFSAIFLTRYHEVKQELSLGISGYLVFLREVMVLFALVLVPFFLWIIIKKSILLLDMLREFVLGLKTNARWVKPAAIWIQRLIPFVPWVVSIIVLRFTETFLADSVISEVNIFIPYINYYFYYRIARRVVVVALTTLSTNRQVNLSKELKLKITKTSKYICRYFLITQSLIYAFASLVNGGIIYLTIVNFVHFLTLGLIVILGAKWIEESLTYLKGSIKEDWHSHLSKQAVGVKRYFLGLPLLVACLVVLILRSGKSWAGELEVSKRISAQVFRRRVEKNRSVENDDEGYLPLMYQMKFENNNVFENELYVPLSTKIVDDVKIEIDEWLEGKSDEHSLAIYGDKGLGKTTLIKAIANEYQDLNIIELNISEKILTEEAMFQALKDVLTINLENGLTDLLVHEKTFEKKTLVFIDNAHNLFLSKVGGFKGIKKFLEIINARTNNIFWIATFNRYSWTYLDNVFGKNHYFRVVKKLRPWSVQDIKSMIMIRHYQTGYSLSYDAIIDAAKAHDGNFNHSYIEERFFRLLWEQSKGNPTTAIFLWLSSLKRSEKRKKELEAGLPVALEIPALSKLTPDALFVYNEIIRHENLSTQEILDATDLPEGVVRYSIKVGLENDFIVRSQNGRYTIATELQHIVNNYLRVKNFIYGD